MAYTSRPFNYTGTLPNQVQNDLNLADDNFEILGQAFIGNDPSSQPIKRAVYIGSTPPADAVANTLWFDTSVSPPVLKVYDGTNWRLVSSSNADTVDNFHASLTPAPNVIVPLNASGILDLSATSALINVYTIRRINGDNLTTDYPLAVGEEAIYNWDTTASLNKSLRIATSGGIYQILINAPFNTSVDNAMFFYPNNTSYTNAFTLSEYFCNDGSTSAGGYSTTALKIDFERLGSGGIAIAYCSTYTDRKFLIIVERITRYTNGGAGTTMAWRWNDTTTAWTSLGTLSVNTSNGTIYVLVRRLL